MQYSTKWIASAAVFTCRCNITGKRDENRQPGQAPTIWRGGAWITNQRCQDTERSTLTEGAANVKTE